MNCVVCGGAKADVLLSLPCGSLDRSTLYNTVTVVSCDSCGHVFNNLTEQNMDGLLQYYEEEYSLCNIQSPNKDGDTPGSSGHNSNIRYSMLYDIIGSHLNKESVVLDMGCAMGGFLCFLKKRQHEHLYGIDYSSAYVAEALKIGGIVVKQGAVENTLFENSFFDFVIADQVVEHLFDVNKIFLEAKRILKKGGLFCVSVPNAFLYNENYFFDFYWFLMREHIQHFDEKHLIAIAKKHGFSVEEVRHTTTPFITKDTTLPNLSILFKNDWKSFSPATAKEFDLKFKTQAYIRQCYRGLENKRHTIDSLGDKRFYVWGISREFLYLYKNTTLRKHIIGLFDDIPTKQKCAVDDMPILPSRAALELPTNSCIFITAYAHRKTMKDELKNMGYKGEFEEG